VPVNCGAIPENLLESELFGYVRGAFSGADRDKPGLFEVASGGTLFLDEIGEMPSTLQVKLLRVLQESEIRRLGDTRTRQIDVRLVAATNKDLEEEIRAGNFRRDLYYRIAVVPIHLVPLRQRRDEVAAARAPLHRRYNRKLRMDIKGIDADAMRLLLEYSWPGNVRELENTIERAMVLTEGTNISVADLPEQVSNRRPGRWARHGSGRRAVRQEARRRLERRLIRQALERTGGNKTRAAELLELSSRALLYKIREYGLE
jgi:two-component system, NtrC family, response regulator AtoC